MSRPVLTLRNKLPGQLLTGSRTELLLDGKDISATVKSFKFEVDAKGVGVATIEMYANWEMPEAPIEVNFTVEA